MIRLGLVLLSVSLFVSGCKVFNKQAEMIDNGGSSDVLAFQSTDEIPPAVPAANAAAERDEIFSLLAYSIVQKDWQTEEMTKRRGHNIGAVLVDNEGKIRHWGRNSNDVTCNGTQHAEVRMITQFLGKVDRADGKDIKTLNKHSIYTTLEPCAMCSGMMIMQTVQRTVYGQTDFDFGRAIERLKMNSAGEGRQGGFKPFPRTEIISEASKLDIRKKIDETYKKFILDGLADSEKTKKSPKIELTIWLRSPAAKALYDEARSQFDNYKVKFPENAAKLAEAHAFLANKAPTPDAAMVEESSTMKCESIF